MTFLVRCPLDGSGPSPHRPVVEFVDGSADTPLGRALHASALEAQVPGDRLPFRLDYLIDGRCDGLTLAVRGEPVSIALDRQKSPAVQRAAAALAQDLADVCGRSASTAPSA